VSSVVPSSPGWVLATLGSLDFVGQAGQWVARASDRACYAHDVAIIPHPEQERIGPVLGVPGRPPNGLEMSRPASQSKYRAKRDLRLAGSAPSSC